MADQKCNNPRHHHYDEEEKKRQEYGERPVAVGDEVAAGETKDRGLFGFTGKKEEPEFKKPQYQEEEVKVSEYEQEKVSEPEKKRHEYGERPVAVGDGVEARETKDRGLFGFPGKKEEPEFKKPQYQEEGKVSEYEKEKVSEPEKKRHEYGERPVEFGDEVAAGETTDRGLFGFTGKKEEPGFKKPQYQEDEVMASEFEKEKVSELQPQKKSHAYGERPVAVGDEVAVGETKDQGLFGFKGKKEEPEFKTPQYQEEEAMVSEFEKVKVSEPEPKVEEYKQEEKQHHSLMEEIRQSDRSSYEEDEKKKGLKETIKEKIPGAHKKEEVKIQKYDVDTSVYNEAAVAQPTEEKKGLLEKMKDKLPGGHNKKTEEVPPPPPPSVVESVEVEPKEKKGIFDKIKEKIPGYHPKTEEEKEKIKDGAVSA